DLKPTDPAGVGEIRGTIVDEKGAPIADAHVGVIANSIGTTGVTGIDGRFALRDHWIRTMGEPRMKLRVAVIKDAFGRIDTRPPGRPDDPKMPIDFGRIVLRPGKSIRVRVVDEDGKPAVGAWVEPGRTFAAGSQVSMTDERGECVIRNLPAGPLPLRVTYGD